MILAVDVAYLGTEAVVGGVLFRNWLDEEPAQEFVITCRNPDKYTAGRFYRRELPCIIAMLKLVTVQVDCIIVDGFVHLGRERKPGLGKYLWEDLGEKLAVIGVAKSAYRDTPLSAEVLRGGSRKPLYVTAAGIPAERAKSLIKSMHGKYRIPTLLKYVDRLCREAVTQPLPADRH